MKRIIVILASLMALALASSTAFADSVFVQDWGFNVNGTIYYNPNPGGSSLNNGLPANINASSYDLNSTGTGMGTVTITLTGVTGNQNVAAFFDLDSYINLFNEQGSTSGTAAAGQSWEIGNPVNGAGLIYTDFNNIGNGSNALINGYTSDLNPAGDDVSFAMDWNFNMNAGDTAVITFTVGTAPGAGLNVIQTSLDALNNGDPDPSEILSGNLNVTPGNGGGGNPPAVPEPSTLLLVCSSLGGVIIFRKRFLKR
jgi:hypothetical protein